MITLGIYIFEKFMNPGLPHHNFYLLYRIYFFLNMLFKFL